MTSYLSYFKLKYITGLQYRIAALAGLSTQFFFGFVYVSIYVAFYQSGGENLPMTLQELINYIWLEQAFFALIYMMHKDKEILDKIRSGNLSYELVRPQNLYFMWYFKIYGEKLSNVTLRFLPVIIVAIILPKPYNLVLSGNLYLIFIFLITLILSSFLVTALILIYHIICMFTLDSKGIISIFTTISDLLSGLVIPIPFFPKILQKILDFLPFRYVSDFPFRLYSGNIDISSAFSGIIIQIIWIAILVILGNILTSPFASIKAYSTCDISKYPLHLNTSNKSFISNLTLFNPSLYILPFCISIVGSPEKNLLRTILFIVRSETKYAITPNITTASTPYISSDSKLIIISAAKLPIDIPIT